MSIFNRFASKDPGKQEKKSFHPTSYRRMFSELEMSSQEARELHPEDAQTIEDFTWALKEACRARYKKAMGGYYLPMKAEPMFYLSKDRMCAYACVLPPENEGEDVTLEEFLGDIHYEGIVYGVFEESVRKEFTFGCLHIFLVARGRPPQAGTDGSVTELFQRRGNMPLAVQNGSEVDFSQDVQLQPIRKGTAICDIAPPQPGVNGIDVTGTEIPSAQGSGIRIPQGKNTAVRPDGLALVASTDGMLYMEDGLFCIHAQKIIDGGLEGFHGTLSITGNLYIGGSVDGGGTIEATGDIVIDGRLARGRVSSTGGAIRIQGGVYGVKDQTSLFAASQIQAPVIEWADVEAGTSVITETVSNSTIHCGGTVYAMTGRGMIVDSQIWAGDSVLCLRAGKITGGRSYFSVGYPPHIPETWERLKTELRQAQTTIETLWGPITALRKKGSKITDRERELLEKLAEQRELYLKHREALAAELKTINKALDKRTKGRVRCEKLYPFLDVQIGRLTEAVTTIEDECNIHVEDNVIELK